MGDLLWAKSLAGLLGFPLLSAASRDVGVCACLAICLVGCFARGDLVKLTRTPTARTLSKPSRACQLFKEGLREVHPGPLLLLSGMGVDQVPAAPVLLGGYYLSHVSRRGSMLRVLTVSSGPL